MLSSSLCYSYQQGQVSEVWEPSNEAIFFWKEKEFLRDLIVFKDLATSYEGSSLSVTGYK